MRRLTDSRFVVSRVVALCTGMAILAPSSLTSQAVTGRLIGQDSESGVEGAIVWLLQEDGLPVARVLSDENGEFRLHSLDTGRFQVRSQRIGFADSTSEIFELGQGQTIEILLEASTAAVPLEGLVVTGESRCDLEYGSGEPTDQLWREARKALTAAVLTGSSRLYSFRVRQYSQELRPGSLGVARVNDMYTFSATHGNPIRSRPVEDLQRSGYVQSDSLGVVRYFGPDAEVLLSDEFLNGHCFRVERDRTSRSGPVGLRFEPTPEIEHPDVTGTLWLDERTAELRYLEYRYTDLPAEVGDAPIGGRIDFERLPGGSWIVRRWFIRMPHMTRIENDSGRFLGLVMKSLKETGGEILEIRDFDPEPLRRSLGATPAPQEFASAQSVRGTVRDDESGVPLQRADVTLLARRDSVVGRTITDEDGRFVLRLPNPGAYRLRATRVGYAPATTDTFALAKGQDVMAGLRLQVSPALLATNESVGEEQARSLARVGFYRREAIGFGQVRTPEDLAATPARDIAELLRGMNGVQVTRVPEASSFDVFSTRGPRLMTCRPSVSIDHAVVQVGGQGNSGWQNGLDVVDVTAVEVYPGQAGIPEWMTESASPCGAVVLWTSGYVH